MRTTAHCVAALFAAALAVIAAGAHGQAYPERPITLLFPYAAGSGFDLLHRAIAAEAASTLGQPMVVEARPGGAQKIALGAVKAAKPDGYFISAAFDPAVLPILDTSFKFALGADYTPIQATADIPNVLFANANVPFRDVQGLIAYAKANPSKLNAGSGGPGSNPHVMLELFKYQAGVDITHVPYKGQAQSSLALASGEIQLLIGDASLKPMVDAGKLIVLATAGKTRLEAFSGTPTFIESGMPNYSHVEWCGLVAPPGTPSAVISKLNDAVNKALRAPAVVKALDNVKSIPTQDSSPAEFLSLVKADNAILGPAISRLHIKLD